MSALRTTTAASAWAISCGRLAVPLAHRLRGCNLRFRPRQRVDEWLLVKPRQSCPGFDRRPFISRHLGDASRDAKSEIHLANIDIPAKDQPRKVTSMEVVQP